MRPRLVVQIGLLILPLTAPARAQQYVRLGSELDDYVRYLELAGRLDRTPLVYRSPSLLAALGPAVRDTGHPWATRYPLSPSPAERHRFRLEPLDPELVGSSPSSFGWRDWTWWRSSHRRMSFPPGFGWYVQAAKCTTPTFRPTATLCRWCRRRSTSCRVCAVI